MNRVPNGLARTVALTISSLILVGRAHAACLQPDADADGFFAALGPGCPPQVDCDDADASVNPAAFESPATSADDNCNQRSALLTIWMDAHFAPPGWVDVGTVAHLAGTGWFDQVRVGTAASGPASTTRTLAGIPLTFSVAVAVKVSGDAGSGASCDVRLGTVPTGGGAVTWVNRAVAGTGVHVLSYQGAIPANRTLKKVQIACYGSRGLTVDWLQVQDNLEEFGPLEEAEVTWKDVRNPGADATIAVVSDDDDGHVWLGTDTSGVATLDANGWHPQNGTGTQSLMMGGTLGASDILPISGASHEVFILGGDVGGGGPVGGLWFSPDDGESWEQLGSSMPQWPPTTSPPATPDYTDDVAAYSLESNCGGSHFGRAWLLGGGRHLQGQSVPAVTGEPVYIANGDWDNLGVSVYDPASVTDPTRPRVCPLANSGDPLPMDRVGALLRVDALPAGTPALVVGYRARVNSGASIYVCELPLGGVDCSGTTSAACQVVDVDPYHSPAEWDLSGLDVRDFEEDTWSADLAEITDWTGVLVADGGARPADLEGPWIDTDADGEVDTPGPPDGIGDAACTFTDSHLLELFISDIGAGISVDVEPDLADSLDMPQLTYGTEQLTGISIDPFSQYVYANVPRTSGSIYAWDRIYRVPAADLLDPSSTPLWEAVNSGEDPAPDYWVEDDYEAVRASTDLDLSGGLLEATLHGRPDPFPARSAPGKSWDTVWIWDEFAFGPIAVVTSATSLWAVEGLDEVWDDNEGDGPGGLGDSVAQAEGDVWFKYWPTINEDANTFQGWPVNAVGVSPDGQIWSAAGDESLSHFDGGEVFDPANPNGSEVDCLWHGWHASASSIAVVPAVDPDVDASEVRPGCERIEPPPSVVWATLAEGASDGNPHVIGVIRTMDNGASWRYAGAGWDGMEVDPAEADARWDEYGARECIDRADTHRALQFDSLWTPLTTDIRPPANAFSTADPSDLAALQDTTELSLGYPANIRALNEESAIVLFRPADDGDGLPVTDGGLYLTIDGGSTWHPVEFDGGEAGCDERTTWQSGSFELIHPGADSYWDPDTGTATYDLLYTVREQPFTWPAGWLPTSSSCSLARVSVMMGPADSDPAPATWSWYTYPANRSLDHDTASGYCGVTPLVLEGAVPSLTSNEAMVFGEYRREGTAADWRFVYGGGCLFDLDQSDLTGQFTMVVDAFGSVESIYAVASHPQVADLWAVLPTMAGGDYLYCADERGGWNTAFMPATAQLECDYPWPLLVQGTANGFTSVATRGPPNMFGATSPVSYPVGRVSSAVWSDLDIPDDSSACGLGSYLVVGTLGQGTWRGEFTW